MTLSEWNQQSALRTYLIDEPFDFSSALEEDEPPIPTEAELQAMWDAS